MALTALEVFKFLPASKKAENTNCKKCGFPTCMTFALKLVKNSVDVSLCPYANEELKNLFQDSKKIQQYEITFDNGRKIGGETVMFRHDKTFINEPAIFIKIDFSKNNWEEKYNKIKNYNLERVGKTFKIDGIVVQNFTPDNLKKIENDNLIIIEENDSNYNFINNSNLKIINGSSIEDLEQKIAQYNEKFKGKIIIKYETENKKLSEIISDLTEIRKKSIIDKDETVNYPIMTEISSNNVFEASMYASALIGRYANMIVFAEYNEAILASTFALIQNLYTNPQKPLQVESKVYEINNPDDNAIVIVTTNFALTYFAVLNEIESTKYPVYLVILPSDGMSVLTAWSADKFTPEMVAKMFKESEILNNVKEKKVVIPGLLSHIAEDIQEVMPEWEVITGSNEAYKIQEFLDKNFGYKLAK